MKNFSLLQLVCTLAVLGAIAYVVVVKTAVSRPGSRYDCQPRQTHLDGRWHDVPKCSRS